jgi:hypothetical protein
LLLFNWDEPFDTAHTLRQVITVSAIGNLTLKYASSIENNVSTLTKQTGLPRSTTVETLWNCANTATSVKQKLARAYAFTITNLERIVAATKGGILY